MPFFQMRLDPKRDKEVIDTLNQSGDKTQFVKTAIVEQSKGGVGAKILQRLDRIQQMLEKQAADSSSDNE